jgi:hypothetical protein
MARKKLDFADSVGGAYTTLGANLGSFFILFAGWVALVVADMIGYVMAAGFYSFAYLQLTAPDESHIVQAPPALER